MMFKLFFYPAKGYLVPTDGTHPEENPKLRLQTDTSISEDGHTKIVSGLEIYPDHGGAEDAHTCQLSLFWRDSPSFWSQISYCPTLVPLFYAPKMSQIFHF